MADEKVITAEGAENGNPGSNVDTGMTAPAAPSNDPPEPTAEEKAKVEADLKAKDTAPDEEEKKVAAEKLEAEKAAADEAEAKDKDGKELDTDVWGSTGDQVADSVLQMLQNADVSPDEAKALLFDAVKEGDLSKIDRDALTAKVGEAKASLIMAGVENFVGRQASKNEGIIKEVEKAAGGAENWKTMAAWGKANIPEADLIEYRTMIDNGGAQARFAAGEIATRYNADEKNTSLSTDTTTPSLEGDGGPGASARKTTRNEYVAELTKAHRSGASDSVIAEITAARHRGRSAGIT